MAGELDYGRLSFLTLQAVIEVVLVSSMGFWAAKVKLLNPTLQRQISQLNVDLFTPCLVFAKLGSSLSLKKIIEVAVIPVMFVITTLISLACGRGMSKLMGFNKRESNFVTAMAVFGNSNSLPVSLTLSLAKTLADRLRWDNIENDTSGQIASRGILYLLIFQQLGQILRWSWGYNTLLAKPTYSELQSVYSDNNDNEYSDNINERDTNITASSSTTNVNNNNDNRYGYSDYNYEQNRNDNHKNKNNGISDIYSISGQSSALTDSADVSRSASVSMSPNSTLTFGSGSSSDSGKNKNKNNDNINKDNNNENIDEEDELMVSFHVPRLHISDGQEGGIVLGEEGYNNDTLFNRVKKNKIIKSIIKGYHSVIGFMNPPLWSMLLAIIVCAFPQLQHELFQPPHFLHATLGSAIKQGGQVAVPLILVVLGGNLAPNEDLVVKHRNISTNGNNGEEKYKKIIIASLISRMVLPAIFLLPLLALVAKYTSLSILDDPIFLVVCFLLTVSPPAIQLSQICQINQVFEYEMAGVLFWGYVVLALPSSIFAVVISLQVLQWSGHYMG